MCVKIQTITLNISCPIEEKKVKPRARLQKMCVTKPPPTEWKWVMKYRYVPLLPWPPRFFAQDQSHRRPQIQSWAASHRRPWCWSAAPRHFHMLQDKEKILCNINIIHLQQQLIGKKILKNVLLCDGTYSWKTPWARSHQCHVGGCQQKAGGCLGNE